MLLKGNSQATNVAIFFISFPEDDVQKVVSLSVDGEESQLVFIDHAHTDMSVSRITMSLYTLSLDLGKETGLLEETVQQRTACPPKTNPQITSFFFSLIIKHEFTCNYFLST